MLWVFYYIKIIQEAMFSSTNEVMGTSYRSRIDDPKSILFGIFCGTPRALSKFGDSAYQWD